MTEIILEIEEDIHEYWSVKDQQELLDLLEDVLASRDFTIYDTRMEGV